MSTLKIYGIAQSRALRTLWLAEELGLDFEHVPVSFMKGGGLDAPEFRQINPNSRVPVIDDDGFRLWESMAINLYLARKHGGPLAPARLEDDARTLQWSFWVVTEVERPLLQALVARLGLFDTPQDTAAVHEWLRQLEGPLAVLDAQLADQPFLLGSAFTLADLNVAAVLYWLRLGNFDTSAWPNLSTWLDRCIARPAFQRASQG